MQRKLDMTDPILQEQVIGKFTELCQWGIDIGIDNVRLSAILAAFADRLSGDESDESPLERYTASPHGDNPLLKPV